MLVFDMISERLFFVSTCDNYGQYNELTGITYQSLNYDREFMFMKQRMSRSPRRVLKPPPLS